MRCAPCEQHPVVWQGPSLKTNISNECCDAVDLMSSISWFHPPPRQLIAINAQAPAGSSVHCGTETDVSLMQQPPAMGGAKCTANVSHTFASILQLPTTPQTLNYGSLKRQKYCLRFKGFGGLLSSRQLNAAAARRRKARLQLWLLSSAPLPFALCTSSRMYKITVFHVF